MSNIMSNILIIIIKTLYDVRFNSFSGWYTESCIN